MLLNNWEYIKFFVKKKNIKSIIIFSYEEKIAYKVGISIAKLSLCKNKKDIICNKCSSCLSFKKEKNTNFFNLWVNKGNTIKISDLNKIFDQFKINQFSLEKYIFLLGNLKDLSDTSFNLILNMMDHDTYNLTFLFFCYFNEYVNGAISSRSIHLKLYNENEYNYKKKIYLLKKYLASIKNFEQLPYISKKIVFEFKDINILLDVWIYLCKYIIKSCNASKKNKNSNKKLWFLYDFLLKERKNFKNIKDINKNMFINNILLKYIKLKNW